MPEVRPEEGEDGAAEAVEDNMPGERCDDAGYARLHPADMHGLDIDQEFGNFVREDGGVRSLRKPANWRRAIDLASEGLLDEMRTLLETVHVTNKQL